MKKKDLGPILLIVGLSAIFSFIISNALFGSPKTRQQQAEKASPISADFTRPDDAYFNQDSVNPTQIIRIGGGNNETPFGNQ